jgi:hypothetical protein
MVGNCIGFLANQVRHVRMTCFVCHLVINCTCRRTTPYTFTSTSRYSDFKTMHCTNIALLAAFLAPGTTMAFIPSSFAQHRMTVLSSAETPDFPPTLVEGMMQAENIEGSRRAGQVSCLH